MGSKIQVLLNQHAVILFSYFIVLFVLPSTRIEQSVCKKGCPFCIIMTLIDRLSKNREKEEEEENEQH